MSAKFSSKDSDSEEIYENVEETIEERLAFLEKSNQALIERVRILELGKQPKSLCQYEGCKNIPTGWNSNDNEKATLCDQHSCRSGRHYGKRQSIKKPIFDLKTGKQKTFFVCEWCYDRDPSKYE